MGRETDAVAQALFAELAAEPYRYDFYDALRRLECAFPDRPRWAQARGPEEEPVRLGQDASMAFAPASLASFTESTDREPPRLLVHLFGLLGPNGPLPLHLTEYARDRQRHHNDRTLVRFLDVLQHRFIALFYRAWAQAQPHVNRDRPADDRFALFTGSLVGLGRPVFTNRDAVPDLAKLFHASTLVRQVRNADGLGAVLQHYFQVPVRVVEFVGHWMTLGVQERTRLSRPGAELGGGAVLGGSVWDRQSKFRLELGPLTLRQYEAFLPGGAQVKSLVAWVRTYACFELEWDARLSLKKSEVPALTLGRAGRLGWTSWLGKRADADANDLCLDAEAFEARAGVRAA
jgi:type VI secretion system protein ImpH